MKPLFSYPGAKSLAVDIVRPIADRYSRIIEPFAGSLALSYGLEKPFYATDLCPGLVAAHHWATCPGADDLVVGRPDYILRMPFMASAVYRADYRCSVIERAAAFLEYIERISFTTARLHDIREHVVKHPDADFLRSSRIWCAPYTSCPIVDDALVVLDPPYHNSAYVYSLGSFDWDAYRDYLKSLVDHGVPFVAFDSSDAVDYYRALGLDPALVPVPEKRVVDLVVIHEAL